MKRKYWYFITTRECVLCGYSEETRERRYTPKPEDWLQRREFIQFTCGMHFVKEI